MVIAPGIIRAGDRPLHRVCQEYDIEAHIHQHLRIDEELREFFGEDHIALAVAEFFDALLVAVCLADVGTRQFCRHIRRIDDDRRIGKRWVALDLVQRTHESGPVLDRVDAVDIHPAAAAVQVEEKRRGEMTGESRLPDAFHAVYHDLDGTLLDTLVDGKHTYLLMMYF